MFTRGRLLLPSQTQTTRFTMDNPNQYEDSPISEFCRIVAANTLKGLTITQLAVECGQSPTKFKQEFKKIFGDTPHRWVTRRRLEFAQQLLENTTHPVKAIAQQAGFSTASHFIRLFKAEYGHTPTHHRKLYGKGDTQKSCSANCGSCPASSGECCCNNIRNGQCPRHHTP